VQHYTIMTLKAAVLHNCQPENSCLSRGFSKVGNY